MKVEKVSEEVKEYQFNNLLAKENHLTVVKSQLIVKAYDLWVKDEMTFEQFKKELDESK